ncbi:unnamed protein product [Penicillium bialowiezense]
MTRLLEGNFGITPTTCCLKRLDKAPEWTLADVLSDINQKLRVIAEKKKCLFIFYHVECAGRDQLNNLVFSFGSGKMIEWDKVRSLCFSDGHENVHALGILDCCCAGAARSDATSGPNQMTRTRTTGPSFTFRPREAFNHLRSNGTPLVSTNSTHEEPKRTRANPREPEQTQENQSKPKRTRANPREPEQTQENQSKPKRTRANPSTPSCHFSVFGGSIPICLPFKRSQEMSPIRQVPFSAQNPPRDKEVLVKLLISGQ